MYIPSFFKIENTEEIHDFISPVTEKIWASSILLLLIVNKKGRRSIH
jgi:hypothetical protein